MAGADGEGVGAVGVQGQAAAVGVGSVHRRARGDQGTRIEVGAGMDASHHQHGVGAVRVLVIAQHALGAGGRADGGVFLATHGRVVHGHRIHIVRAVDGERDGFRVHEVIAAVHVAIVRQHQVEVVGAVHPGVLGWGAGEGAGGGNKHQPGGQRASQGRGQGVGSVGVSIQEVTHVRVGEGRQGEGKVHGGGRPCREGRRVEVGHGGVDDGRVIGAIDGDADGPGGAAHRAVIDQDSEDLRLHVAVIQGLGGGIVIVQLVAEGAVRLEEEIAVGAFKAGALVAVGRAVDGRAGIRGAAAAYAHPPGQGVGCVIATHGRCAARVIIGGGQLGCAQVHAGKRIAGAPGLGDSQPDGCGGQGHGVILAGDGDHHLGVTVVRAVGLVRHLVAEGVRHRLPLPQHIGCTARGVAEGAGGGNAQAAPVAVHRSAGRGVGAIVGFAVVVAHQVGGVIVGGEVIQPLVIVEQVAAGRGVAGHGDGRATLGGGHQVVLGIRLDVRVRQGDHEGLVNCVVAWGGGGPEGEAEGCAGGGHRRSAGDGACVRGHRQPAHGRAAHIGEAGDAVGQAVVRVHNVKECGGKAGAQVGAYVGTRGVGAGAQVRAGLGQHRVVIVRRDHYGQGAGRGAAARAVTDREAELGGVGDRAVGRVVGQVHDFTCIYGAVQGEGAAAEIQGPGAVRIAIDGNPGDGHAGQGRMLVVIIHEGELVRSEGVHAVLVDAGEAGGHAGGQVVHGSDGQPQGVFIIAVGNAVIDAEFNLHLVAFAAVRRGEDQVVKVGGRYAVGHGHGALVAASGDQGDVITRLARTRGALVVNQGAGAGGGGHHGVGIIDDRQAGDDEARQGIGSGMAGGGVAVVIHEGKVAGRKLVGVVTGFHQGRGDGGIGRTGGVIGAGDGHGHLAVAEAVRHAVQAGVRSVRHPVGEGVSDLLAVLQRLGIGAVQLILEGAIGFDGQAAPGAAHRRAGRGVAGIVAAAGIVAEQGAGIVREAGAHVGQALVVAEDVGHGIISHGHGRVPVRLGDGDRVVHGIGRQVTCQQGQLEAAGLRVATRGGGGRHGDAQGRAGGGSRHSAAEVAAAADHQPAGTHGHAAHVVAGGDAVGQGVVNVGDIEGSGGGHEAAHRADVSAQPHCLVGKAGAHLDGVVIVCRHRDGVHVAGRAGRRAVMDGVGDHRIVGDRAVHRGEHQGGDVRRGDVGVQDIVAATQRQAALIPGLAGHADGRYADPVQAVVRVIVREAEVGRLKLMGAFLGDGRTQGGTGGGGQVVDGSHRDFQGVFGLAVIRAVIDPVLDLGDEALRAVNGIEHQVGHGRGRDGGGHGRAAQGHGTAAVHQGAGAGWRALVLDHRQLGDGHAGKGIGTGVGPGGGVVVVIVKAEVEIIGEVIAGHPAGRLDNGRDGRCRGSGGVIGAGDGDSDQAVADAVRHAVHVGVIRVRYPVDEHIIHHRLPGLQGVAAIGPESVAEGAIGVDGQATPGADSRAPCRPHIGRQGRVLVPAGALGHPEADEGQGVALVRQAGVVAEQVGGFAVPATGRHHGDGRAVLGDGDGVSHGPGRGCALHDVQGEGVHGSETCAARVGDGNCHGDRHAGHGRIRHPGGAGDGAGAGVYLHPEAAHAGCRHSDRGAAGTGVGGGEGQAVIGVHIREAAGGCPSESCINRGSQGIGKARGRGGGVIDAGDGDGHLLDVGIAGIVIIIADAEAQGFHGGIQGAAVAGIRPQGIGGAARVRGRQGGCAGAVHRVAPGAARQGQVAVGAGVIEGIADRGGGRAGGAGAGFDGQAAADGQAAVIGDGKGEGLGHCVILGGGGGRGGDSEFRGVIHGRYRDFQCVVSGAETLAVPRLEFDVDGEVRSPVHGGEDQVVQIPHRQLVGQVAGRQGHIITRLPRASGALVVHQCAGAVRSGIPGVGIGDEWQGRDADGLQGVAAVCVREGEVGQGKAAGGVLAQSRQGLVRRGGQVVHIRHCQLEAAGGGDRRGAGLVGGGDGDGVCAYVGGGRGAAEGPGIAVGRVLAEAQPVAAAGSQGRQGGG